MNSDDLDHESKHQLQIRNDELSILTSLYTTLETLVILELAFQYYVSPQLVPILLKTSLVNTFIPETSTAPLRFPIVLAVNGICMLLHLFEESPKPIGNGSKMLTGGVLTDFVGEFPYSSRLKLISLDLLVLGLMVLMMAAGGQKKVIETRNEKPTQTQDIEAEEEGRRASTEEIDAATDESEEAQALLEPETLPTTYLVRLDVVAGIRQISNAASPEAAVVADDRREILRGLLRTLADRANPR